MQFNRTFLSSQRSLLVVALTVSLAIVGNGAVAQAPAPQSPAPKALAADRAADLESRLIDLQVQIATVRSLSANARPAATGVAPAVPFQPVAVAGRQQIASLESKARSLAAEIRRLSGRSPNIQPSATEAIKPRRDDRPQSALPAPSTSGWAGSTTVTPSNGYGPAPAPLQPSPPAISQQGELQPGTVYGRQSPSGKVVAGWAKPVAPRPQASLAPRRETPSGDAEAEYQTAYGYLLQQDYGAAQTAFSEFLTRHPNTNLAGNAQYWIGETHYVRGAYKEAAVAFLKGYEQYGDGNKGPDSLLKLALALGKLRQTTAACSSLRELAKRYGNGPRHILARAKSELQRMRCS